MKRKTDSVNLFRMALCLSILFFGVSFLFILYLRTTLSDQSNQVEMFLSQEFLIFAIASCVILLGVMVGRNQPKKFMSK